MSKEKIIILVIILLITFQISFELGKVKGYEECNKIITEWSKNYVSFK